MKKRFFAMVAITLCIVMAAAGTIGAQPIKKDLKLKPLPAPNIPVKKLQADLAVSHIGITPPAPRVGIDMVRIEITVKNRGTATPSKVCSLSMSIKNTNTRPDYHHEVIPWYTNNIPQLAPGAEITISKVITIPYVGMYMLSGVIITEGLQLGEENAQNNSYKLPFQVTPEPAPSDLAIESLMPTNDGRIRIKMYNKGASIPDFDFDQCRVTVEVNDTFSRNVELKAIDPAGILKKGEPAPFGTSPRITLEYIWPSDGPNGFLLRPGGNYKVRVTLDANHSILDSDWSNNAMTVAWHMTPSP